MENVLFMYGVDYTLIEETEKAKEIITSVLGDWKEPTKIQFAMSNGERTLGYCKALNVHNRQFLICISKKVKGEKRLMETIIHELLHSRCLYDHHGGEWKNEARIMSAYTPYTITRLAKPDAETIKETEQNAKYLIVCEKCGMTYARNRMGGAVKNPSNYRCGKCKGTLKVIQNF